MAGNIFDCSHNCRRCNLSNYFHYSLNIHANFPILLHCTSSKIVLIESLSLLVIIPRSTLYVFFCKETNKLTTVWSDSHLFCLYVWTIMGFLVLWKYHFQGDGKFKCIVNMFKINDSSVGITTTDVIGWSVSVVTNFMFPLWMDSFYFFIEMVLEIGVTIIYF